MRHHHHKDSSCKRFRHRMHIGTHFTAYEMEKDNRRKRFASTHHNHIMVNITHNSSKKCVKKTERDLKGICTKRTLQKHQIENQTRIKIEQK